ncbi:MAG: zinc dependent phospholipase C family protein [Syntrophobacteraceae bacterium]
MPKERFHIYLADQLARLCETRPPVLADLPAFFIGAVSPDIFYYDLPHFSLSPVGDWIHGLEISAICDWISDEFEKGNLEAGCWGLGFACHFLADAVWHPLIEQLSEAGLGLAQNLSVLDSHRLLESEIEAFWFAKSSGTPISYSVRGDFWGKRERLLEIASHYASFLEFAGGPRRRVSEKRIARCFLWQNFLLRLFANKTLGRRRDLLLAFPPTRSLGVLVAPSRPMLPDLLARSMPEQRNPFSDSFMNRALESVADEFCRIVQACMVSHAKTRSREEG